MDKYLKYNAPFNKRSFLFLKELAKQIPDQHLSKKLLDFCDLNLNEQGIVLFDDENNVVNMLCPYHNDHSMGLISGNSSMVFKDGVLICFSCSTNRKITFYRFLTQRPLKRTSKELSSGHVPDESAIKNMDLWCEIFDDITSKYGGFIDLINDFEFEDFDDFIYLTKAKYTVPEQKYLSLLQAIVFNQSEANDEIAINYFKTRGFSDVDFIKSLNPFYLGSTIEEVQSNLLQSIDLQTNPDGSALFSSQTEKGQFLYSLKLLHLINSDTLSSILTNHIGLPILDEVSGAIINFNLRDISGQSERKYLYFTTNIEDNAVINDVLANLKVNNMMHLGYWTKPKNKPDVVLTNDDNIYLNEGIYDTLSLRYNNINAVCAFTKLVSIEQLNILLNEEKAYHKIVLAFDNDHAGIEGMTSVIARNPLFINKFGLLIPPRKFKHQEVKDWNDIQKIYNQGIDTIMQKHNLDRTTTLKKLKDKNKDLFSLCYQYEIQDQKNIMEQLNAWIYSQFATRHYITLDEWIMVCHLVMLEESLNPNNDVAFVFANESKTLISRVMSVNEILTKWKDTLINANLLYSDINWISNNIKNMINKLINLYDKETRKQLIEFSNNIAIDLSRQINNKTNMSVFKDLLTDIFQAYSESYKDTKWKLEHYYDQNTGKYKSSKLNEQAIENIEQRGEFVNRTNFQEARWGNTTTGNVLNKPKTQQVQTFTKNYKEIPKVSQPKSEAMAKPEATDYSNKNTKVINKSNPLNVSNNTSNTSNNTTNNAPNSTNPTVNSVSNSASNLDFSNHRIQNIIKKR